MTRFAEYRPGAGGLPPAPVAVRRAVAADAEAIVQIEIRAGRAPRSVGSADGYRRIAADPGRCLLVAECQDDDGRDLIVGWAKTHFHQEVIDAAPAGQYLAGITVDPSWRRRGVAAALTDMRMRWIGERAGEAFYVVNVRNGASIDLHRRWGFEEVLRAPRLMGLEFPGGVGLLMRAALRAESRVLSAARE